MLFKYQPPSLRWVLATRRRVGIAGVDDNRIVLPENVCPHAFYGANATPFKYGKIDESDAHSGYRALAYCLFFEEDKYPLMRQLLSSYVVLHAGDVWVKRKCLLESSITGSKFRCNVRIFFINVGNRCKIRFPY